MNRTRGRAITKLVAVAALLAGLIGVTPYTVSAAHRHARSPSTSLPDGRTLLRFADAAERRMHSVHYAFTNRFIPGSVTKGSGDILLPSGNYRERSTTWKVVRHHGKVVTEVTHDVVIQTGEVSALQENGKPWSCRDAGGFAGDWGLPVVQRQSNMALVQTLGTVRSGAAVAWNVRASGISSASGVAALVVVDVAVGKTRHLLHGIHYQGSEIALDSDFGLPYTPVNGERGSVMYSHWNEPLRIESPIRCKQPRAPASSRAAPSHRSSSIPPTDPAVSAPVTLPGPSGIDRLAVDSRLGRAFAQTADGVGVIDATSGRILATTALAATAFPVQLAVDQSAGTVVIAGMDWGGSTPWRLRSDGFIAILDAARGSLLHVVDTGPEIADPWDNLPTGIAVDAALHRVFILHSRPGHRSTVIIADTRTGQVAGSAVVAPGAQFALVDPATERLFIACFGAFHPRHGGGDVVINGSVVILDPRSSSLIASIPLAGAAQLALETHHDQVLAASSFGVKVVAIDAASGRVAYRFHDGLDGSFVAIDNPTGHVFTETTLQYATIKHNSYVPSIQMTSTGTGKLLRAVIPVPDQELSLADDPRAGRLFVGSEVDDKLYVIDTATGNIVRRMQLPAFAGAPLAVDARAGRGIIEYYGRIVVFNANAY